MKYAVDEIIDNIVTLEDIETKEKKYIEKELLPEDIYDGAILIYEDDTYKLDISEETLRRKRIIEKLNRLKNNQEIANYIIERDLLKTKCQLELSLASLCIILRKMCENQFITLNQERRKDINSIIHSNRFDFFEDDKVYVFSQKGQEEVNIIQLLDYAKKIFKEIV